MVDKKPKPKLRSIAKDGPSIKRRQRRTIWWRLMFAICVMLAIGCSTYALYLYIPHQVKQVELKEQTANGEIIANRPDGSNEAVDENRISEEHINDYKVPADHPRVIEISKINVRARVVPLGLNNDKSIQSPTNVHDAGWYTASAKPGQVSGRAMFIDGHDIGATGDGVFKNLHRLAIGDKVNVQSGDGANHEYIVQKVEVVAIDKIDMNKVLSTIQSGKAGLNLMTCDGAVTAVDGKITQTHRVIVYTVMK